jgi:hypothetical protein
MKLPLMTPVYRANEDDLRSLRAMKVHQEEVTALIKAREATTCAAKDLEKERTALHWEQLWTWYAAALRVVGLLFFLLIAVSVMTATTYMIGSWGDGYHAAARAWRGAPVAAPQGGQR